MECCLTTQVFFHGAGSWFCTDPELYRASDIYIASGVFALSEDDEVNFRHTLQFYIPEISLNGVNLSRLPRLVPSNHKDDEFSKITKENPLYNVALGVHTLANEAHNCYFHIIENLEHSLTLANEVNIEITSEIPPLHTKTYQSDQLKILNEAGQKFWGNADPEQKDTQPINDTVIKWLIDKGFSKISAQQGASIVRPAWAAQGRRSAD